MPAATARTSYGSVIQTDFSGGTTYATLAEIFAIHPPGLSVPGHKAGNLSSPSAVEEYKPGMIEPGKSTFDMRFTPTLYQSLLNSLRTQLNWKIIAPLASGKTNAAFVTFLGHIDSLPPPSMPEDGVIVCAGVSIKVSGPVTYSNES